MMQMGPDRYPPIAPGDWTDDQKRYAQPLLDGPRKAVISPFVPLLRSPELMDRVQETGAYLRYRCAIGTRLTELAILVTARHWDQPVEWAIHAPIAERSGIDGTIICDLSAGKRPRFKNEDEQIVFDCAVEILETRRLSDHNHARANAVFGDQGVIDLLGVVGYYTLLSIVMNGAQTEVPPSDAAPLAPIERDHSPTYKET
jgi:4-carboxymuconolactone decarboxylase